MQDFIEIQQYITCGFYFLLRTGIKIPSAEQFAVTGFRPKVRGYGFPNASTKHHSKYDVDAAGESVGRSQ